VSNNIPIEKKQELCKLMSSNLSTLREKANLTQNELADKLGLARQTISAIETKKRDMHWSTFSVLIRFFAKNEELKQIMSAMGIIHTDIEKVFSIETK
jgi:DNA-binding XRE family transcriptional regulator